MKTQSLNPIKFLLILLFLHQIKTFQITPIKSSSGLFYKHLGKAQLTTNKFTLLTYYNLTLLSDQINSSYMFYYKSLAICNKLYTSHIDFHCQNQLKYIRTKIDSIQANYAIISHQLAIIRQKRGLINGVGDGLKWLFGVPDADDAQFYTDSINSLMSNQKQTETLIQQQIKIISSTISNFNTSMQILNKNNKVLNENIKKFNEFMEHTASFEERITHDYDINQHIITLIEMTDEVQNTLNKYVDSLSLINQGIISFNLISPKDLLLELNHINTKYNLPLEANIENTYIYYKLLQIKSFIKDNLLVIALDIPLTNSVIYDLYEIHSLFTPHNDPKFYSYIEPAKPFLLLSLTRTVYSTMNNLHGCQEYVPHQWLCRRITTTKRIEHATCEVELFFKTTTTIPESCNVKHLYADTEIWNKVSNNEWLFIISKPTTLSVLCNQTPTQEETIQRIGLLQLQPNCKAYTEDAILEADTTVETVNITNKFPSTSIIEDDCCRHLKENVTIKATKLKPLSLANLDLNELKYAKHKLNQFDEILQQQLNKPFIIQHSNWFTLVLSSLGGLAIIIILYNVLKWFGITTLLYKYLCCAKEPRKALEWKSCCLPCVNIYNQSYNTRTEEPHQQEVRYDNEMERLYLPTERPTSPTKISGGRSTRSTRSTEAKKTIALKINSD